MSLINKIKEVSLLLVGQWYSTETDTYLIFDFSENLKDKFHLTTIKSNKELNKTLYEIHSYPGTDANNDYRFYIKVGVIDKEDFYIKRISKNELVLNYMKGFEIIDKDDTYVRNTNLVFADDILKEIN